jgi:glycosyltransferase involved in cell wall biosynthesis
MKVTSISVVIPTFNDAGHIGEALASIIAQTRRPGEIIVADDVSTDNTREVVCAFAEQNPALPIRYLRLQMRGGVVGARNHGIRQARGEWIATCDSDDIWVAEKLQRQTAFISAWEGQSLSLLATYGYNVNDRGRVVSPVTMGPTTVAEYASIRKAAGIFYLLHSSIIFPKACYDSVGGYTDEYGPADDCDFWTRMSDVGVVLALAEPLVYYRKRSGSIQLARFADKESGVARLTENRRRAAMNLRPLSSDAFEEQLAAAPFLMRLRRRRSFLGAYHYRTGAACMVNGQRSRGAFHLLMASGLDRRRLTAGIKSALAHRLSSRG